MCIYDINNLIIDVNLDIINISYLIISIIQYQFLSNIFQKKKLKRENMVGTKATLNMVTLSPPAQISRPCTAK